MTKPGDRVFIRPSRTMGYELALGNIKSFGWADVEVQLDDGSVKRFLDMFVSPVETQEVS